MRLNGDISRLQPEAFLIIADHAEEWSLAATDEEVVLYVRNGERINMYYGPSRFYYTDRELYAFYFKLRSRVLRARKDEWIRRNL